MNYTKYVLMLLALLQFFGCAITGTSEHAFSVGNELKKRTWRDGADQITFIDLTHSLPKEGKIISWSFYAPKYANGVFNSEPRNVKLQVFRNIQTGYKLIGESPYFTVGPNGWDMVHKVTLINPIYVKEGDYIGWYYPTQGLSPWNGGVIAFEGNTPTRTVYRWNQSHTDRSEEPLAVGDMVNYSELSGDDQGRTYSIQVDVALIGWLEKLLHPINSNKKE